MDDASVYADVRSQDPQNRVDMVRPVDLESEYALALLVMDGMATPAGAQRRRFLTLS